MTERNADTVRHMTHIDNTVDEASRRELLKLLGVTSTVAVGGVTLEELRETASVPRDEELARVGRAIRADLSGSIDADYVETQQAALVEAASALPEVREKGLPAGEPRNDFGAVATAQRGIYDHLVDVGFFQSTTDRLPDFSVEYLESNVRQFARSEALAAPLAAMGLDGTEGVDLLATVVDNARRIGERHWIATDELPREQIELGDFVRPMTRAAAGGGMLWLDDLDLHLWQDKVLISEQVLSDAVWHARATAAGFQLMSEGAKAIGNENAALTDRELTALLTTGFAVQAISQSLLKQDAYWITEEMRASRRTDLETIIE